MKKERFLNQVGESLMDIQKSMRAIKAERDMAVDALEAWQAFWDNMPKGQLGKISCDIGLLNDAFIKTSAVLRTRKAAA